MIAPSKNIHSCPRVKNSNPSFVLRSKNSQVCKKSVFAENSIQITPKFRLLRSSQTSCKNMVRVKSVICVYGHISYLFTVSKIPSEGKRAIRIARLPQALHEAVRYFALFTLHSLKRCTRGHRALVKFSQFFKNICLTP